MKSPNEDLSAVNQTILNDLEQILIDDPPRHLQSKSDLLDSFSAPIFEQDTTK